MKFRSGIQELELGFGSKSYRKTVRFINQDGSVNVRRTGLKGLANLDVYHWLIALPSGKFSLILISFFVVLNLIFGGIYFLIGAQYFGGIDHSNAIQEFLSLVFFSSQTITTLGFGHIYPISNAASLVAAFESLLGLMAFAIVTGLLFGRFSRPKAYILYSRKILFAPYDDITGLMFRITNKKQSELIEVEAKVTLTMNIPETGKRDFFNLDLEINRINFLALSWTIVHPINEESPLYGLTVADLEERDAEVLILVKGINDTFSQTVYSRYSYKAVDFVTRAKFKPLKQEADLRGKVKISVTDIHHYDIIAG
jgi:inward rectifier potassium channel